MLSQAQRAHLLQQALSEIPVAWAVTTKSDSRSSVELVELRMDLPSPTRPAEQQLAVLLRPDGDIQIEYHVAGQRGSPFEWLLGPCARREQECVTEAKRIVVDLLAERLVLAYDGRLFRGGRRFVSPSELGAAGRRHLTWVTSWRGTYDWHR